MNETSDSQQVSVGNGAAIIERFGGIRPMASKINVPVTTVQGWKKRDAIPLSRIEQIQQAARDHNLDISDILKPSNENEKLERRPSSGIIPSAPVRAEKAMPAGHSGSESRFDTRTETPVSVSVTPQFVGPVSGDVARSILQAERKAVAKSLAINFVLLAAGLAGAFALLWPGSPFSHSTQQVTALEQKVAELKIDVANVRRTARTETEAMGVVIPPEVQQKINELQQKIDAAAQSASAVPDMSVLEQRLAKLEQGTQGTIAATSEAAAAIAAPMGASLAEILNRFNTAQATPEGAAKLNAAWASLVALMSGYQGDRQALGATLHEAASQNPDLASSLVNDGPQQIEASAMLFAMAQVRAMLGRENVPVESDLRVLKALAGSNDPELNLALDNLMPLAGKSGIMTADGLSKNLTAIAGEVAQASLTGENVSLTDIAKAQIGQVMQVEKQGEQITGNPVQALISKAQGLLQGGDIAGAVATLNGLSGPAASALAPWMSNAQATLAAQQLKNALTRSIAAQTGVTY